MEYNNIVSCTNLYQNQKLPAKKSRKEESGLRGLGRWRIRPRSAPKNSGAGAGAGGPGRPRARAGHHGVLVTAVGSLVVLCTILRVTDINVCAGIGREHPRYVSLHM